MTKSHRGHLFLIAALGLLATVTVSGLRGQYALNGGKKPSLTESASKRINSVGVISLSSGTSVGLGQSTQLTLTLSVPAPDAGVTVILTSGDTSVVTVTPSVFVPGGRTSPNVQPQVMGLSLGLASISASAPGFASDSQKVNVTANLDFSPGTVTLIIPTTQNLALNLSGPAPVGGLKVDLAADNSQIATVPTSVRFPAGARSVSVPVTGVGIGSTVIRASALPNLREAILNVIVSSAGTIAMPPNLTLGLGQSVTLPLVLSVPAPTGGLTITLSSTYDSRVTVVPKTVTIPGGATMPTTQPQITALGLGIAIINASAPGFFAGGTWVEVSSDSGQPSLTKVDPSTGLQGQQNLAVTITGQFTHFIQGTTTLSFGAGVTVGLLTVSSATVLTAKINIDPAATVGARPVTVTTGSEVVSLSNGFTVLAVTPAIELVNPNFAEQGQQNVSVTITGKGTNFVAGTTQVNFGAGITICKLMVASATSLTAQISAGIFATIGPRAVTVQTGAETALLASGFTIAPPSHTGAPTWSQLAASGSPQGYLALPSMNAFNAITDRWAVLFQGSSTDDVWALTRANGLGGTPQWVAQTVLPDPTNGLTPSLHQQGSAVYDSASNRMIIFGGQQINGVFTNEVWVLSNADGSGAGQSPAWMKLTPTGAPPAARIYHTAIYDPTSNRMTIFGGGTEPSNAFSDVWVLSNANGLGGISAWTQLNPTGGPPVGRFAATAVYDPSSGSMIVFGGSLNGVSDTHNAVWMLTNATGQGGSPVWINLVPEGTAGSPPLGVFIRLSTTLARTG